jgi:Putative zinc-finger
MRGCKKCRDLLAEALYGDLDPEQKAFFENHIGACPSCAAEVKALTGTLTTMDKRVRPDPGQEFWDGYWDRLAGRMREEGQAEEVRRSWIRTLGRAWNLRPRWALQAVAAIVLIAAGIIIGRTFLTPPRVPVEAARQEVQAPPVQAGQDDPVLRARNYINRSKLVLLALVNYDSKSEDPYGLDLPFQKQVSQELVNQAGAIKSDLKDPSQRRLRELVGDLETLLLQIANLEAKNDLEAVEFVKQGVGNRGILLKINLSEMGGDPSEGVIIKPAAEKPPAQKNDI